MLCIELFFPLTLALSREGRGKILEWVMPMLAYVNSMRQWWRTKS